MQAWNISPTKAEILETSNFNTTVISSLFWEHKLSLDLMAYIGIFTIILGIFGNTSVIITLCQKKPYTSTGLLLMNLAIADLAANLIGQGLRVLPRALAQYDMLVEDPIICKLWFLLCHSTKNISGWI